MGRLVYSMGVSLDGYVNDRHGGIGWSAPDEELHRFHNRRAAEAAADLYGRRLYEAMAPWEHVEAGPDRTGAEVEFADIWRETPRYVFSRTLDGVESGFTLIRGDAAEEVRRLKAELDGDLHVGGPGLAGGLIREGLVDEVGLFVSPVVLGGGTPFLPDLDGPLGLALLESRTFGSRVVYLRYLVEDGEPPAG